MTEYKLKNLATGREFDDTGWILMDPEFEKPSLIRSIFKNKQIEFKENSLGIYKFSDWLPINRYLSDASVTVTYRSKKLADYLKLDNLYISFSGYWPEKGANMTTCSFKETEAYSVCARIPENNKKVLVVASAGNTARAFAKVCSDNKIPLLLVVPFDNIDAMWFTHKLDNCVKLVCTPSGTDYYDAIDLSAKICKSPFFLEEGGAKNVARRDGMGTTVLSAVNEIGKIPDYYFQAIGSGTGTIAAWEANLRLIEDGRFGNNKMVLIPSQNIPFTPMHDSWKVKSRSIIIDDDDTARDNALKIGAKVLSNRKPPYSIPGGLFDALSDTNGLIEIADNAEMESACNLFEKIEGIDIHPAAGVALAGMIKIIDKGIVDKSKVFMLNITGGGEKRIKAEKNMVYHNPNLIIENKTPEDVIINMAKSLFL